ncbi:MAG: FAD-binding protein, partial [Candidatus Eremiobacteraeota bacterium]|nr:FAD-binding protein [Candidatus Eremiobacteraeota bacterium]
MNLIASARARSVLTAPDKANLRELCAERVAFDEPLAPYTSWKIGGPADAYVTVESELQLASLMRFSLKRKLPWFVLGSGSNLLVGDGGIRGLILRLAGSFTSISVRASQDIAIEAGASASMAALTSKAASAGAVGIGSLAGIPGSVGGSLRMNAGTDREMGDFVRDIWVQTPTKPEPHS